MSGNVKYTRKLLSDKTLEELVLLISEVEERFSDLKISKIGIYLDDDKDNKDKETIKAVYGLYIGSFLLKGINKEELIREIEIYERFANKGDK